MLYPMKLAMTEQYDLWNDYDKLENKMWAINTNNDNPFDTLKN